MLTSQTFTMSFSFGLSQFKETAGATLAFSGSALCLMLIFTAFSESGVKKFEASFTSLGRVASDLTAFLYLYFELSF